MKKKHIRKYIRRADDYMEAIDRKIDCMDKTLFLISLGLEYFYQKEDCQEVRAIQLIRDNLKALNDNEIAGLHEVLNSLKDV